MSEIEKNAIATNLGTAYYKLTIYKIAAIILCTISCCSTVFWGVYHLESRLASNEVQIHQHDLILASQDKTINAIKEQEIRNIWVQIANMQNQINQHITDDAKER